MKIIVASCLVSQNGHYYPAHLCDDGDVYINWDGKEFVSSQVYERFHPRTDSAFGNQHLDIYEEVATFLKTSIQTKKHENR